MKMEMYISCCGGWALSRGKKIEMSAKLNRQPIPSNASKLSDPASADTEKILAILGISLSP